MTEPLSVKGTLTEQNLLKAFAGESQAYMRYSFFASVAAKEGYEQIAAIFRITAENERQHAKSFFKHLEGGMTEITASYPSGIIGTTDINLIEAAAGEHDEGYELYPEFGRVAADEGFGAIARLFDLVAGVEMHHERRYLDLLDRVQNGTEFISDNPEELWICRKCGFIHRGKKAPEKCPTCGHSQAYFERMCERL